MAKPSFVQDGYRFDGDWDEAFLRSAARFGRLSQAIDANRSWLQTLRKITPKRYAREKARVDAIDKAERVRKVSANQPFGADDPYGKV